MIFPGFIGGSCELDSYQANAQRALNLYVEQDPSGSGKSPATLRGCPGLKVWATLPASPIRAMWRNEFNAYAVAGSKFYQLSSTGQPINGLNGNADRGDVGSDGKPAQIFSNGNQLLIVSAGLVYVDTGTAIVQPKYTSAQGSLNTNGTAVSLVYGDTFDASMVGQTILIANVGYQVASVTDPFGLVLSGSGAGTQNAAPYLIPLSGNVQAYNSIITWVSGDKFPPSIAGQTININGASYTVVSVDAPTQVTISGSIGASGSLPYWASPPVTASAAAFLDGYFISTTPSTKQFDLSRVNDGLRWDPIDYATKEGYPDNLLMVFADHEELWLMGTDSIEVWRNTGNNDFPFQRDPGAFIHMGLHAQWSPARLAGGLAWVGSDDRGGPVAYRAQGYVPQRISTHSQEQQWRKYSTAKDAEGFSYTEDGHQFWQITFPSAEATWCYDANTNLWHERDFWQAQTTSLRHRARNHMYAFGKHLVGDWASGTIYEMSQAYTDDAGSPKHYIRTFPHLADEHRWIFYNGLRLDMQPGANLTATARISKNAGKSFGPSRAASAEVANDTGHTVLSQAWRRWGRARDAVFEINLTGGSSGTGNLTLVNAYLDAAKGN